MIWLLLFLGLCTSYDCGDGDLFLDTDIIHCANGTSPKIEGNIKINLTGTFIHLKLNETNVNPSYTINFTLTNKTNTTFVLIANEDQFTSDQLRQFEIEIEKGNESNINSIFFDCTGFTDENIYDETNGEIFNIDHNNFNVTYKYNPEFCLYHNKPIQCEGYKPINRSELLEKINKNYYAEYNIYVDLSLFSGSRVINFDAIYGVSPDITLEMINESNDEYGKELEYSTIKFVNMFDERITFSINGGKGFFKSFTYGFSYFDLVTIKDFNDEIYGLEFVSSKFIILNNNLAETSCRVEKLYFDIYSISTENRLRFDVKTYCYLDLLGFTNFDLAMINMCNKSTLCLARVNLASYVIAEKDSIVISDTYNTMQFLYGSEVNLILQNNATTRETINFTCSNEENYPSSVNFTVEHDGGIYIEKTSNKTSYSIDSTNPYLSNITIELGDSKYDFSAFRGNCLLIILDTDLAKIENPTFDAQEDNLTLFIILTSPINIIQEDNVTKIETQNKTINNIKNSTLKGLGLLAIGTGEKVNITLDYSNVSDSSLNDTTQVVIFAYEEAVVEYIGNSSTDLSNVDIYHSSKVTLKTEETDFPELNIIEPDDSNLLYDTNTNTSMHNITFEDYYKVHRIGPSASIEVEVEDLFIQTKQFACDLEISGNQNFTIISSSNPITHTINSENVPLIFIDLFSCKQTNGDCDKFSGKVNISDSDQFNMDRSISIDKLKLTNSPLYSSLEQISVNSIEADSTTINGSTIKKIFVSENCEFNLQNDELILFGDNMASVNGNAVFVGTNSSVKFNFKINGDSIKIGALPNTKLISNNFFLNINNTGPDVRFEMLPSLYQVNGTMSLNISISKSNSSVSIKTELIELPNFSFNVNGTTFINNNISNIEKHDPKYNAALSFYICIGIVGVILIISIIFAIVGCYCVHEELDSFDESDEDEEEEDGKEEEDKIDNEVKK